EQVAISKAVDAIANSATLLRLQKFPSAFQTLFWLSFLSTTGNQAIDTNNSVGATGTSTGTGLFSSLSSALCSV
ncbi:hypothetical protein AMTR_s00018p00014080, partial [Amborella trichopoda]